jgi:hypothetical protein
MENPGLHDEGLRIIPSSATPTTANICKPIATANIRTPRTDLDEIMLCREKLSRSLWKTRAEGLCFIMAAEDLTVEPVEWQKQLCLSIDSSIQHDNPQCFAPRCNRFCG